MRSLCMPRHPTGASRRPGREQMRAERPARAPSAPRRRPRSASPGRPRSSTPISSSIETRSSVEMLPGRPRRHRAAAELAEGALEGVDALLERGQHVGEALAAGVVEVGGQLDAAEALARAARRTRRPGAGLPCRSCRRRRSPRSRSRPASPAISKTRSGGTSPSYGQPKLVEITPSQRMPASRAAAIVPSRSASDSAIERLTFFWLWRLGGREEEVRLLEAVAELQRVLEALAVGDQHRVGDAVARLEAASAPRRRRRAAGSRRAARTR